MADWHFVLVPDFGVVVIFHFGKQIRGVCNCGQTGSDGRRANAVIRVVAEWWMQIFSQCCFSRRSQSDKCAGSGRCNCVTQNNVFINHIRLFLKKMIFWFRSSH
jgi:hypothetical protein